jgi:hypothetical protein
MKSKFLFAAKLLILPCFLVTLSLSNVSCGGKDKKKEEVKPNTETVGPSKGTDDGMVPKIDTASLKDEASILDAIQKVVDARIADEKKQKDDAGYAGHYVELMTLHTAVLKASTAYSQTLNDPSKSIEFSKKFSAIEDKLYPK